MYFQSHALRLLERMRSFWMLMVLVACVTLVTNGLMANQSGADGSKYGTAPASVSRCCASSARRRRRRHSTRNDDDGSDDIAASYSRYSSDLQREERIVDQQRNCDEHAQQNSHRILPDLEFADEAVSGTKLHRTGLDAMLQAAEAGEFKTLYVFSLSRLARESVITMPLLKKLVYVWKVRVISTTEGIDSDRDGWDVIASIMALMHERYIKELSESVFSGQEGAVLAGLCVGDYCFGYTSEPIPGSEQGRKGRNAKPRMAYVIDEKTSPWVVRIFNWFVHERCSLRWITRELNRRGAPKDHRSTKGKPWRHQQVARVLANEKYIGIWPWGELKNTRDPMTGALSQELRSEEDTDKWVRHFDHLTIGDRETFDKAQQLLDDNYEKYVANRRENGRLHWKKRGSADCPPQHLLSQLIKCEQCGRNFHVGGSNGKYLFCPGYKMGVCDCQTQLRRDRAERMILGEIAEKILASPAWFACTLETLVKTWHAQQEQMPAELTAAMRSLEEVDQRIARLVDRIENGMDDPDVKRRLDQRRTERRTLLNRVKTLGQDCSKHEIEPTETWLREQLQNLGENLQSDSPAAAYALRDLVGGQIVVTEIRKEGGKRHHLRGEFTIRVGDVAALVTGDGDSTHAAASETDGELFEHIVIDFVDPNPLDQKSEEAKLLYDQGVMNAEIAQRLGCSRSQVTKLLKHWFESRGLTMPDGRSRRGTLTKKHLEPPVYQKIADEAMVFYQRGMLLGDIAEQLECDRNTVTSAVRWWHEQRGLPVPDGRTRRKELDVKSSPKTKDASSTTNDLRSEEDEDSDGGYE
jgi:site-specific DNA recombinase